MSDLPEWMQTKQPTLRTGDVCGGDVVKQLDEETNEKIVIKQPPIPVDKDERSRQTN